MNLVLQLLPYVLFAIVTVAATGYYVANSSARNVSRHQRAAIAPVTAGNGFLWNQTWRPRPPVPVEPIKATGRSTIADPQLAKTSNSLPDADQILRLHSLGIAQAHIASALQLPLQEVELTVRAEQRRPVRPTPYEIQRAAVVE